MGRWRGHYCDLWSRYSTVLGPAMTTVVVFECLGSIQLEKMLFTYARKLHLTGEVFCKEALNFQLFLEFCSDTVMCNDKVSMPTNRSEEVRDHARKKKEKQKEQKRHFHKQQVEGAKLAAEVALDQFIEEHCEQNLIYKVKMDIFRNIFNSVAAQNIKQVTLKEMMQKRGFPPRQGRVQGSLFKVYIGLRIRACTTESKAMGAVSVPLSSC